MSTTLNLRELQRYLGRVGDRWPLAVVMVGGARVDDFRGAPPQRERGPEFVVVLGLEAAGVVGIHELTGITLNAENPAAKGTRDQKGDQ